MWIFAGVLQRWRVEHLDKVSGVGVTMQVGTVKAMMKDTARPSMCKCNSIISSGVIENTVTT